MRIPTALAHASLFVFVALLAACGGKADARVCTDPAGCGGDGSPLDAGLGGAARFDASRADATSVDPSATNCGSGACPSDGYICKLACNECGCNAQGWACTHRACAEGGTPGGGSVDGEAPGGGGIDPVSGCTPYEPKQGEPCAGADGASCIFTNGCGGIDTVSCKGGMWNVTPGPCSQPPQCPSSAPKNASACAGQEGAACSYVNNCGGQDQAFCKGGSWYVSSGACPPAPGCPSSEPRNGAVCSTPAGTSCSYTNGCGGRDTATCAGTVWSVSVGPCPLPPGCPTAEPRAGTSCTGTLKCPYPSACGAVDTAACQPGSSGNSTWTIYPGTCPSTCPTALPKPMTSCAPEGLSCKYGNGCGGTDDAYCKGGNWAVMTGSCNPGCSAQMPASGSSCSSPSATPCVYIAQNDPRCTSTCYCATDVRWACLPPSCTP